MPYEILNHWTLLIILFISNSKAWVSLLLGNSELYLGIMLWPLSNIFQLTILFRNSYDESAILCSDCEHLTIFQLESANKQSSNWFCLSFNHCSFLQARTKQLNKSKRFLRFFWKFEEYNNMLEQNLFLTVIITSTYLIGAASSVACKCKWFFFSIE